MEFGFNCVSRAARSCCTIFESADPRRRPAWSSPTSFIVVTTVASSTILSIYCRTSLVSCNSIRSLELRWTFSHPHLYLFSVNGSRYFFFVNPSRILLWHFCSHRTRCRGLCNSFTISATLKIAIDIDIDQRSYSTSGPDSTGTGDSFVRANHLGM